VEAAEAAAAEAADAKAAEAAAAETVAAAAAAAVASEAAEAAAEEEAAKEAAVDDVGAGQEAGDGWGDADGWGEAPSLESLPRGCAAEGPQTVAEEVSEQVSVADDGPQTVAEQVSEQVSVADEGPQTVAQDVSVAASAAAAPSPSVAATALPPGAVAAAAVPPPSSSWRQSAPLVQMAKDGRWQLCPEGTTLLSAVRTPLVVVACAGLYRTGKSFFLNALAGHLGDKASRGFRVGSTSESCTRGIDVCIVHEPPAPAAAGGAAVTGGVRRTLVLLDSEGIASMDQDETYDSQIFSLALLLSSYFVLNSMGVIDEAAIDRLFLITEISKRVCAATGPAGSPDATTAAAAAVAAEEEEAGASSRKELSRFFPPLLWLLRDFVLELRDDKGAPLSPDQYMERALESRAVGQRRADERNETRAAIRELSPRHRGAKAHHDCMLMASNCLPHQP
jgi:hypothetical protein